jgi:hypothetical protein
MLISRKKPPFHSGEADGALCSFVFNRRLYRNNNFQFVVCLQPFVATAPQSPDPMSGLTRLEELFRIIDPENGYLILGMRETDWDKHDLTIALHKDPLFQCMSMQRLQYVQFTQFLVNTLFMIVVSSIIRFNPSRMNEYGAVIDDDEAVCVIMEETEDTPMEHYMVCLLQKRSDASLSSGEVKILKHKKPVNDVKFKGSSYKRY